jgi:DNA-binding NarL/FixJ family response regulator
LSSQSHSILVADSDEIVAALLSHLLHRQGYMVDVALSADAAAQHLQQKHFDAIIIDSKLLSAMDGFPDGIGRTIVLGGDGVSGAHASLSKPIEFGSFIETVAACVK